MGRLHRSSRLALVADGVAVIPGAFLLWFFVQIRRWNRDCLTRPSLPDMVERHRQRIGALFASLDENDPALDEALGQAFDEAARDMEAAKVARALAPYADEHLDRMRRSAAASRALAAAARAGDRAKTTKAKAELAVDGVSMQGKYWSDIQGACVE
jgi:hypothetical protein